MIWVNRSKETLDAARRSPPPRSRPSSRRRSSSAPPDARGRPARRRRRRRLAGLPDRPARSSGPATRRSASTRRCSRTSWRSCRRSPSRRASRSSAAGHARRLGPPARALRVRRGAAGVARVDRRAAGRPTGRGAARAARVRRGALRRAPRAAVAAGRAVAARARTPAGSASWSSSCTPPTATPRTAWRSGCHGRGCLSPATTCPRWRSRCCARPAPRRAYLATLTRLEPLVEQAGLRRGGPRRADRRPRAAAILREDRAYLEALIERGAEAKLPLAGAAQPRRRCTPRTRHAPRREPARGAGRALWPDAPPRPLSSRARRGDPRRRAGPAGRRPPPLGSALPPPGELAERAGGRSRPRAWVPRALARFTTC